MAHYLEADIRNEENSYVLFDRDEYIATFVANEVNYDLGQSFVDRWLLQKATGLGAEVPDDIDGRKDLALSCLVRATKYGCILRFFRCFTDLFEALDKRYIWLFIDMPEEFEYFYQFGGYNTLLPWIDVPAWTMVHPDLVELVRDLPLKNISTVTKVNEVLTFDTHDINNVVFSDEVENVICRLIAEEVLRAYPFSSWEEVNELLSEFVEQDYDYFMAHLREKPPAIDARSAFI